MTVPEWTLLPGDCRLTMRLCLAPDSIDSVVTDPPYDLTSIVKRFGKAGSAPAQFGTDGAFSRASRGFMGMTWDGAGVAFDPATWAEVYRVLKPGGHLLAFGGTRTYHRMVCAIEDAGFEIRDQLAWLYGQGFPKSHNVANSIDRMAGITSVKVPRVRTDGKKTGFEGASFNASDVSLAAGPAVTPEAQQWEGWGTALKPALEPIVLARKPLIGTVAANVLQHGTGVLNIDGCRVAAATDDRQNYGVSGDEKPPSDGPASYGTRNRVAYERAVAGRFPANLIHDGSEEVLAVFPDARSCGQYDKKPKKGDPFNTAEYGETVEGVVTPMYRDKGSAARFFYCAKANGSDREEGLAGQELKEAGLRNGSGRHLTRAYDADIAKRANHHPTVKPTALMRYLCRLITPPSGTVLDPFAGSGSTGKAALLEGFSFIGCEMTEEYLPIAEARLAHALEQRKRDH